jgi:hypothetical protein
MDRHWRHRKLNSAWSASPPHADKPAPAARTAETLAILMTNSRRDGDGVIGTPVGQLMNFFWNVHTLNEASVTLA